MPRLNLAAILLFEEVSFFTDRQLPSLDFAGNVLDFLSLVSSKKIKLELLDSVILNQVSRSLHVSSRRNLAMFFNIKDIPETGN